MQDAPLSPFSAATVVKKYAQRVGLDPAAYAGHSLRSGFFTRAADGCLSAQDGRGIAAPGDVLCGYVSVPICSASTRGDVAVSRHQYAPY